jgi:PadR family transcriptional regulator, regulatory protein PadR
VKRESTTLLHGTLDMLVLKSLVASELHGLGISRRIQQITGGTSRNASKSRRGDTTGAT